MGKPYQLTARELAAVRAAALSVLRGLYCSPPLPEPRPHLIKGVSEVQADFRGF